MSRDPEEFIKPELIKQFKDACHAAGITVIITCVGRTEEQQKALYAQNRETLEEVNRLRKIAGYMPITEEQNKKKVTWTMKSNHILNAEGKCHAFDFGVIKDGHMIWDVKVDTNLSNGPDYTECGIIAESLGLTWGGRWKTPDPPHLELT